ncbi:MAG TPA: hypothetical protein VMV52_00100 [Candidatus Nanopelagicaceae bacterium]|nr:hypothetical protein [Candidatus Nanopelagicaceae bacterium]
MRRRILALAIVAGVVGGGAVIAETVGASNVGGVQVLPPAKQKIVDQESLARQKATRADKSKLGPPTQSEAPTARVVGITDQRSGPFPAPPYAVVNEWNGPVNGEWLAIYAGDRLSKLPGELSIVSVSGNLMTLRNPIGTVTTFDFGSKTFQ